MQEVDIWVLMESITTLQEKIPDNIVIVGEINSIIIESEYDQLDLSRVKCKKIWYKGSFICPHEGESIKNHILPNSLKRLDCWDNKLTSLPKLPNSLKILNCCNNKLSSFDSTQIPDSLKDLWCSGNKLTSLPKLPNSLKRLDCSDNGLTSLPKLPYSLELLYCSNNQLTSLSTLPDSLIELNCSYNKLTSLPKLNSLLEEIDCSGNYLEELPDLPNNLKITLYQNNEIDYIPFCKNIKLRFISSLKIKNYPIKITKQKEWDEYMEYKLHQMNRIKSVMK